MADKKITQLPSASIATGSNVLPIVQGGVTDQITVTNLGQGILNLGLSMTGSLQGTSSFAVSASYAASASYTPTLQQVLNSGAGAGNYGSVGSASIQLTNFSNNRTLYLNNNSFPTIKIEDNNDAANNLTIDLNTLVLDNVSYNWSDIVSNTSSFALTASSVNPLIQNVLVTGSVNVSGSIYLNGNKQFNYGAFYDTTTQSGSINVSQSITYNSTDYSQGVSVTSGSRLTISNPGVYNIQFSAQVDRVSGSGTDTIYIWLKKNGTNINNTATAVIVTGGAVASKVVPAWNFIVNASANDYYELAWQATDANIQIVAATASGNIPAIPSIITTVTQVA